MAQSPFQRTKLGGRPLTDWLLGNKWDLTLSEKIFDEHLERQGIAGAVREIARHYRAVHQFEDRDVTIDPDPDAEPLKVPTVANQPYEPPPGSAGRLYELAEYLYRQRTFSRNAFGPEDGTGPVTYGSILDHIEKEIGEVGAGEGKDLEEWIDIVTLAFDGAWRCALLDTGRGTKRRPSPGEIAQALFDKLTKNISRTWPDWRKAPRDGKAIEHIRTGPHGERVIDMPTTGKDQQLAIQAEEITVLHQRLDTALACAASWERECRHVEQKLLTESDRLRDLRKEYARTELENRRLGDVATVNTEIIAKQVAELARLQRIIDEQEDTIRDRNQTIARLEAGLPADGAPPPLRRSTYVPPSPDALRAGDVSFFAPQRRKEDATDTGNRDYYGGANNIYEAIKVITAWGLNFNLGSAIKYILRPGKSLTLQHRVEDLVKAKRYLEFEIARIGQTGVGGLGLNPSPSGTGSNPSGNAGPGMHVGASGSVFGGAANFRPDPSTPPVPNAALDAPPPIAGTPANEPPFRQEW